MKKIYKKISLVLLLLTVQNHIHAQCATSATLGSSSNMYTLIRNGTNPIAADKNLNTIIYAHRNNVSAFGGSSGNIRYDVSMNGGSTWSLNIGVVNPTLTAPARYPNGVIYNPAGNTNPNNAYLGYLAATVNTVSNGWNGPVTGVIQLNGSGNTESYQTVSSALIPNSLVKGAPGVFWSVDAISNGTTTSGFRIYKGTWNGTNDIAWGINTTFTPALNTAFNGTAQVADYNIAFDPTGNFGWMSFLGHLSTGPAAYAYYPIFYKTTDGGNTWTGPIQVNLNQFPCLTSILTNTYVLTTAFEHDLTVDVFGNPHMLTTVCNGNNDYTVYYGFTHHVVDITSQSGLWNAYDIANVNAGRGGWGTSPTNSVTMDIQPQAARTVDGTKLFFNWTNNATYTLGAANQSPNLFSRAYDAVALKWTNVKDFTSCNGATNGTILFPHIASEVLEPTSTSFKMAGVYGQFSVPNDPSQVSNFKFLDNLVFNNTDFTVSQPTVAVSIQQGASWLLCPSNTISLSIAGTYTQVLWNNGANTNTTSVSTGSNYIVTVRNGCALGADTIAVTNLTTNITTPAICIGTSTTLTASTNAFSYTWQPMGTSVPTVVVSPTVNTSYTVTGTGTNGCTFPKVITVTVNPLPTLTITGNSTVCVGSSVVQSVAGAVTYTWSTSANSSSVTLTPTVNSTYTVTGTDANSCVNTQTTGISLVANPTVSIVGNLTVCAGNSTTITASGASTYSWDNGATTAAVVLSPSVTSTYTVIATASTSCIDIKTITVTSNTVPVVGINSNISLICAGSSAILTGNGASTYTWNTNANTTSITVSPTVTTTYSVNGTASNGCSNFSSFTQSVSACTGVNQHPYATETILIYPNPNNGEFIITTTSKASLSIVNDLGQVIRIIELNAPAFSANLSGLSKGIYMVIGNTSGGITRNKLVIN